MVKIITVENKPNFQKETLAMFEERKLVFVDLLKWNIPVTDGRYEIDQFDDDAAVYLLLSHDDGSHLGSMRLLRTDRPHILGSFFEYLCADGAPRGQQTFEVTRLCLSPRLRARERRWVRDRLISALADYALAQGITTLTGVARTSWLSQILAMGWRHSDVCTRDEGWGNRIPDEAVQGSGSSGRSVRRLSQEPCAPRRDRRSRRVAVSI